MYRPSPKFADAAPLALVACIVVFIGGCTSTVRTSPDGVKIEPAAVSHLPARNVTLVNGHASETQLRFSSPPYTLIVEPKHMTDTAIEVLRRALPSGGKGAAKRVVVRVHSPRQAGPYPTPGITITVDADYGDGTRSQVLRPGTFCARRGPVVRGGAAERVEPAARRRAVRRLHETLIA